ncbi:hypothetical protein ACU686_14110 [Yinghuangia aomiensis]
MNDRYARRVPRPSSAIAASGRTQASAMSREVTVSRRIAASNSGRRHSAISSTRRSTRALTRSCFDPKW